MKDAQKNAWYGGIPSSDRNLVSQLCTQPAVFRQHIAFDSQGRGNFTYVVPENLQSVDSGSKYSLALLQCYSLPSASSVALSVDVTTEMWNAQPSGNGRSFLSIEDVPKILILKGEMVVMSLFVTILLGQIALSMKPWYVLKLHFLFLATAIWGLALVAVYHTLLQNRNLKGYQSNQDDMILNIVYQFYSTTYLLCFLLLSLGWCTTRISLSIKEIRTMAGFVMLYFIIGISSSVCMDDNSPACSGLSLATYILRYLLLLGIIIAMNFTVTQLRAGLIHSPWIPSTPVQYARVKQFQMFRNVFILYLLLPTSFLLVQQNFFTWREDWLIFLLYDPDTGTGVLMLYMFLHVGATFSPLQEPFLIRAFDNTFAQAIRAG
jgi:hypothetical protein